MLHNEAKKKAKNQLLKNDIRKGVFLLLKNLPNCRESRRKDVNMSEFKVIETQEELDTIVKARIAREREKYQDYDQLKTCVEELETENSSLQTA